MRRAGAARRQRRRLAPRRGVPPFARRQGQDRDLWRRDADRRFRSVARRHDREVEAAGLQTEELSKAIEAKLAGGYLLEPKVSVQVASFRPVYVLGEVNKPGEYPYTQGLTIRGAVAKADGFTYRANEKRVFLKRAGEAGEREYELTADFPVLPGDTIRFGERYF